VPFDVGHLVSRDQRLQEDPSYWLSRYHGTGEERRRVEITYQQERVFFRRNFFSHHLPGGVLKNDRKGVGLLARATGFHTHLSPVRPPVPPQQALLECFGFVSACWAARLRQHEFAAEPERDHVLIGQGLPATAVNALTDWLKPPFGLAH
jgi:hypothetical protein